MGLEYLRGRLEYLEEELEYLEEGKGFSNTASKRGVTWLHDE